MDAHRDEQSGISDIYMIDDEHLNTRGKVLSLAVDAEKHKVIAVGDSLGKVHLINIDSCSVFSTFCLDAESSVLPTVVWSLLFVGGVLFSGDSKGRVSLWNIKVGGMICSFASHSADVLALAASPDSMSVFAGGVDPIIRRFDFSHSGSSARWQAGGLIHGCQRDVHGLVYIPLNKTGGVVDGGLRQVDRLLAAGDDGRLTLLACSSTSDLGVDAPLRAHQTPAAQVGQPRGEKSSSISSVAALPLWPLSLAPSLPVAMQFARETFVASNSSSPPARLGLLQYADHMNLIHFPRRPKTFFKKSNEANDDKNRNFLCLAEIRPRRGQQVLTCAISPCGRFVAYSDTTRSRVLKVAHPESWLFDRNCPSQLVTISRLGWAHLGSERKRRRRSISRASSEERSVGAAASTPTTANTGSGGTSELDSDSDEGRLFLDQSSADLFTAASNGLPDTELANVAPTAADKKRPSSAMVPADQTDDSSALPAARLLAFTPDSNGLVSVDTATQQVTYLDLQTGCERWHFTPGAGAPVGVHLMRMEKFALKLSSTKGSPTSQGQVTFLALGCADGRVLLHCLETGGQHLFTCPRIHSDSSLCAPRPVAVAFHTPTALMPSSKSSSPARLDLRLSILYTSSQLVEWQVPISVEPCPESGAGKFKVSVREHPVQDPWLLKFWASVGKEWNRRLPPFHSMDYLGPSGDCWILVSAGFVVYLDRTKPYKASDIKVAIRRQSKEADDLCLKVSTKFQTAIQASVLPDRVAIMQIDTPEILLKLPAPLHKKRFGT
ncbi:U3 small nucleolar RNA-associated protein 4 [Sparganum proliferum]